MTKIRNYLHKTQYYETDQMGIIHHSNYIRWFEEARIDFLDQIGIDLQAMEKRGIICPVLEVRCSYRSMTRFGDTVYIPLRCQKYNGIRLVLSYQVIDTQTRVIRANGESSHCFLNADGRPIQLQKLDETTHERLAAWVNIDPYA